MDGMSDIRNEIEQRLGVFARPGAKAEFAENTHYSVAAHIGNAPVGHRTANSLDEAKSYAKSMLESLKAQAKGKPLVVDVYPVVNYEPKPAVLTLRASRPGAKAAFAITKEQIRGASREELRSIEQRLMALAKSGDKNAAALLDYIEEEYNDRYRGTHSRPGAKADMAKFKVGDRVAYKPHPANTAGELVEIRKPTSLEGGEMQYGIKQASGGIMWVSEGMVVRASRSGAKAAFAIPAKWQSEDRYVDQRAQQADEPNAPSFKQGKYIAYVHYRDRSVQVDNMLRRTPPGQYRNELEAYLASVDQKIAKYKNSRPGAKATMGKYWVEDGQSNVKQPVKSMREGIQLVSGMQNGVLRYADHGMTSILAYGRGSGGASLTEDGKLHQKHASSRPGEKAKMAMTPIRVTETEYAALAARDAVSRKILGDSQYQITPSDRTVRAAGDAAYKTALARHNAWDKAWKDAPNDAARAEIEARTEAAEAGMRVYRGSRPGAKDTFADASVFASFLRLLDYAGTAIAKNDHAAAQNWYSQATKMITAHPDLNRVGSSTRDRWLDIGERIKKARQNSRPGAKAAFAGDWHGKRVTSNAGKMFLVQRSATGYDLYSVDSGKKAKSMTQEQMDEAQRAGKFRDVFSRPGAKATAAKPDDKTECADCETEQDKAGLKLMEKADKAVSDKIRTLIKEGKPQDQAVAIALDMKRRGEL